MKRDIAYRVTLSPAMTIDKVLVALNVQIVCPWNYQAYFLLSLSLSISFIYFPPFFFLFFVHVLCHVLKQAKEDHMRTMNRNIEIKIKKMLCVLKSLFFSFFLSFVRQRTINWKAENKKRINTMEEKNVYWYIKLNCSLRNHRSFESNSINNVYNPNATFILCSSLIE